jgi:hypothetical protein
MMMRFAATVLAVLLFAGPVLAEECPEFVPEDSVQRRQLAKKWFTRGEDGIKINDDLSALKAYQCSLKFVPHGFTAFNIAQVAERVGDLELAVASYKKYLLLAPDAKDTDEINQKVDLLNLRLAKVKQQEKAAKAAPPKPIAPPPVLPPPVTTPDEGPGQTVETTSTNPSSHVNYRTLAWVSYGGAAAFILGGVITNLMSRGKMDTCNSKYNQTDPDIAGAESACSAAKPLAYTSYALFGVGGVAAALGTFFVLRPTESSEVAMAPLPDGGLSLRWGGSF